MPTISRFCPAIRVFAFGLLLTSLGCGRETAAAKLERLEHAAGEFGIYWPPADPQETPSVTTKPLLRGTLAVNAQPSEHGPHELHLAVTITRPSTEADRQSWNTTLAFADIAWMNEVRVWDADEQWLWPNLPYLLRLPGKERVERYGGLDPGKRIDNDFAAVLIRKYDATGTVESADTQASPLVSAEWHAVDAPTTDRQSIVHAARSDEFLVHLGEREKAAAGRLKAWLIYADFLGTRPPRSWPKEREWAGGILAYFEVDWQISPDGDCRGRVRPLKPPESTHFPWADWVFRAEDSDHSEAKFRLGDTAEN